MTICEYKQVCDKYVNDDSCNYFFKSCVDYRINQAHESQQAEGRKLEALGFGVGAATPEDVRRLWI